MYNITARGVIVIAITFSAFVALFSSCKPPATYFTLTQEGYEWCAAPTVENKVQFFAYQHERYFMIAKNSVNTGIVPLYPAIAVDQTTFIDSTGTAISCLAFKQGKNYNEPWQVMTFDGRLIVDSAGQLTSLPKEIRDAGNLLRTDDGTPLPKK